MTDCLSCPYCGAAASADHISGTSVMCNQCEGWYTVWHRLGGTVIAKLQEPPIVPADYDDLGWHRALWRTLQRTVEVAWQSGRASVWVSRDASDDMIHITIRRDGVSIVCSAPNSAGADELMRRLTDALKHVE